MTSAARPHRRRSLSRHTVECLEWRGLLSNLPTISAAIPVASSAGTITHVGATAGGTVSYGDVQPADDTVNSGDSSDVQLTTQPADSSVSSVGPTQLVVSFSQPGNAFDLGFADIGLNLVNSDGSTTSVFDPSNLPQEIADDDDGFDSTFTQLTLSLGSALPAGTYQIVLVGGSQISSDIADGRWDPFSDHVISTFTVGNPTPTPTPTPTSGGGSTSLPVDPVIVSFSSQQPNASVESLTDLGTLGATAVSQAGLLTPLAGTPSVQLYRFTLPAGHHWSLDLSANPQDASDGFQTTLSLYEIAADGSLQPVSFVETATGISISPTSPDTFAGVDSGTYCLAVSGIYTTSAVNTSDGPFVLGISATVADQPVSVTGSQLNWANSNDSSPAGLTIEFSGPISLAGFADADEATPPLEVVDTQGRVYGVIPLGYQDQGNILTLAFADPLPAGTYFLKVGAVNGLTDLAGWTPVAGGLGAGILASWSVSADLQAPPESYLGVVWTGTGEAISRSSVITDGTTTYSHFVVVVPGFYGLQATAGSGSAEAQIFSEYGTIYLDSQTISGLNSFQVYLPAGDYTLAWTGQSTVPCEIKWTLSAAKIDLESILNNGVGQWPSFNLGFGSNPGAPDTTSYLPGNGVWQGPMQNPGFSNLMVQNGPVMTQTSSAPSDSPVATLNAQQLALTPTLYGIAGLAPILALNASSAGPAAAPGVTSVANKSSSLPGGLRYASKNGGLGISQEEITTEETELQQPSPQPAGKPTATAAASSAKDDPLKNAENLSQDADRLALASTEWVTSIGQMVQNWFGNAPAAQPGSPRAGILFQETASLPTTQLAELTTDRVRRTKDVEGGVERASFGLPLGVIIATAVAYRGKGPILRWWKEESRRICKPRHQRKGKGLNGPTAGESGEQDFQVRAIHRPHFMSRRGRDETQVYVHARRESGQHKPQ